MKYTAEEVRAIAKRLHDDITVADGDALMASDMLTAYAERIEAAESEDWRIAFFERRHEAAQEKGYVGIAAAITAVPAAEPVAQSADSGRVPDGWVLVPREPTKAMLAAYEHVRSGADWQENVFRLTKKQLARHKAAYTAMLEAALQEKSP